jgi:hypothetical protein
VQISTNSFSCMEERVRDCGVTTSAAKRVHQGGSPASNIAL